jgi:hypothetical protein
MSYGNNPGIGAREFEINFPKSLYPQIPIYSAYP